MASIALYESLALTPNMNVKCDTYNAQTSLPTPAIRKERKGQCANHTASLEETVGQAEQLSAVGSRGESEVGDESWLAYQIVSSVGRCDLSRHIPRVEPMILAV